MPTGKITFTVELSDKGGRLNHDGCFENCSAEDMVFAMATLAGFTMQCAEDTLLGCEPKAKTPSQQREFHKMLEGEMKEGLQFGRNQWREDHGVVVTKDIG